MAENSQRPPAPTRSIQVPLEWDSARAPAVVEELEAALRQAHAWRCADELARAWESAPGVSAVKLGRLAGSLGALASSSAPGGTQAWRTPVELLWPRAPAAEERDAAERAFDAWRDAVTGLVHAQVVALDWIRRPAGAGLDQARRFFFEGFLAPPDRARWERDLLGAAAAAAPPAKATGPRL